MIFVICEAEVDTKPRRPLQSYDADRVEVFASKRILNLRDILMMFDVVTTEP